MEPFSWWNYALALLGSGGAIWGIFQAAGWVKDRIDKRRDKKIEEAKRQIDDEVDLKKAVMEAQRLDQAAATQVLWEVVKEKSNEVKALKDEVVNLRTTRVLEQSVIRILGQRIREIRRHLEKIRHIALAQHEQETLLVEIDTLSTALDSLETALP
jgi:hypothetical protein